MAIEEALGARFSSFEKEVSLRGDHSNG